MDVFWIPVVAIAGSFTMVVLVVWFSTRSKQRRAELRADVQMKLIEKFGSSAELVSFLTSEQGKQFLEQPRRMSRDRMLGGLSGALVCTFLGIAFIAAVFAEHDEGFWIPGLILLGIGIALFISFAISLQMIKRWEQQTPPRT